MGETGGVTAEFAVVLPAVVLVLAACLTGLGLVGTQLRLQDAASGAARALARGSDSSVAAGEMAALVPGAAIARSDRGDLVCVRASAAPASGAILGGLVLTATGCALGGGR